jgi:hypothetical protein
MHILVKSAKMGFFAFQETQLKAEVDRCQIQALLSLKGD